VFLDCCIAWSLYLSIRERDVLPCNIDIIAIQFTFTSFDQTVQIFSSISSSSKLNVKVDALYHAVIYFILHYFLESVPVIYQSSVAPWARHDDLQD
jgi:hypothetical protein